MSVAIDELGQSSYVTVTYDWLGAGVTADTGADDVAAGLEVEGVTDAPYAGA